MSKVIMRTELGDLRFRLHPDKAPVTVANFLRYVEGGLFDGSDFFRIVTLDHPQEEDPVKIETVQGGLNIDHPDLLPPIHHEPSYITGLSHKMGSLSMARYNVGSANGSFFICLRDEPELDYGGKRQPDGQGFAVFAELVEGWPVLAQIRHRAEVDEYLQNPIRIHSVSQL